jgi:hypothetical protein
MKKPYTVGDLAYDRASAEARTRLYAGERGVAVRLAFRKAIALAPDDVERAQMERLQASLKQGRRFGHKTVNRNTDSPPSEPAPADEVMARSVRALTEADAAAFKRDVESAFDPDDILPTGGSAPGDTR